MRESHRNKANSSSTLTRTWCGFAWRIYCLCKPWIFFASSNSQWQQGAHTLFGSTTKFSPLPGIDLVLFIFLGVVIGTVVRVKVYRKMKNDLLSYICMNFRIYRLTIWSTIFLLFLVISRMTSLFLSHNRTPQKYHKHTRRGTHTQFLILYNISFFSRFFVLAVRFFHVPPSPLPPIQSTNK